jgi:hypothetical protein
MNVTGMYVLEPRAQKCLGGLKATYFPQRVSHPPGDRKTPPPPSPG